MSSSALTPKFLVDENVRARLAKFIQNQGFDVKLVPKSISDSQVALISKKEKRVLITNDEDFTNYSGDELFALIWLKIPQADPKSLISSFEAIVENFQDFSGIMIILRVMKWDEFKLGEEIKSKN